MKPLAAVLAFCACVWTADTAACADAVRTLSLDDYRDKMKAAWVGQMVGVSWGQPTEFKWNDAVIPADKVPEWTSDFPLRMAYGNDDLYVEMTFLKTLEGHGLDASIRRCECRSRLGRKGDAILIGHLQVAWASRNWMGGVPTRAWKRREK